MEHFRNILRFCFSQDNILTIILQILLEDSARTHNFPLFIYPYTFHKQYFTASFAPIKQLTLGDCNETQTLEHLDHKRMLNHLANLASFTKCLSVYLRAKWVRVSMQSFKFQISRLFRARTSLISRHLQKVDSF